MSYLKSFISQIPSGRIVDEIKRAITEIYVLPPQEYNSNLFHDLAVGFKIIVYAMEDGSLKACPLFVKWLKLYVRLQHKIDPKDTNLIRKFEKKIPVCTSYILASLQFQTKMANYHLNVLEMCLALFSSASVEILRQIASLDLEIFALLWMPIEFVGDYNTQKLSLEVIVKVLSQLDESERHEKIKTIEASNEIQNLVLDLAMDTDGFEKKSRELLNKFNMSTKNCAVFSVHCATALFGSFKLYKPEKADKFWVDFNYASKSVSVLCQLSQGSKAREELSIQIKIDKLQIENQFDCIVVSIEPATFSVAVSTELKNTRLAVFTLPQREVERLKGNRDLLDFYNMSYSEIYAPPTPNTIEDYLAEETYPEGDISQAQVLPDEEIIEEIRSNSLPTTELVKIAPAMEEQNKIVKTPSVPKKKRPNNSLSQRSKLPRFSGSNLPQGTDLFKKPLKPVRQKPKENRSSEKLSKSQPITSKQKEKEKSPLTVENVTRRFFKSQPTKQGDMKPDKKSKWSSRKRPAKSAKTGISPKRKQVNSIKPLNHLTKLNCDQEEAALEYVENGGYTNIIRFLESDSGKTTFNEEQRQNIIKNIERINEDLDRSAERFFPKNDGNDNEGHPILKRSKRRSGKRAKSESSAEGANFMPYSQWRLTQKHKNSTQSRVRAKTASLNIREITHRRLEVSKQSGNFLNAFDQLKIAPSASNSQSNRKVSANNMALDRASLCSLSSQSSCSNHNFHIADSDNELDEELMQLDTALRQEPEDMDLTPVEVPLMAAVTPRSIQQTSSSKMSVASDAMDLIEPSAYQIDPNPAPFYQASEVYEDVEEIPAYKFSQPITISYSPSGKSQPFKSANVNLSCLSEQSVQIQNNKTIIPADVHTQSEDDPEINDTWFIERYLTEQHSYERPHNSSIASPSHSVHTSEADDATSSPQPVNVTTNQVIIQNQFVLSRVGNSIIPVEYNKSALGRIASGQDRVPLNGYAQLLPNYIDKLNSEKNRLLKELELKLQKDLFDEFSRIVDEVLKSITEHEIAIKEAQEQLSVVYGRLEWLIENQQTNKSKLEKIYCELIGRIKASTPRKADIHEAYNRIEDKLRCYSTNTSNEIWQGFVGGVINSIEDRLRGLFDLHTE